MNFQLDSFNMVHHARYLEFMEEGRWLYCYENKLMDEYVNRAIYHVVVNININYRSSATLGDLITITTELSKMTEKSVIFKQTVLRDETILIVADIVNVYLNKSNNAIIPAQEMTAFWEDLRLFSNS